MRRRLSAQYRTAVHRESAFSVMTQPFLNSNPTPDQLRALIKYLSAYRDGSGNIRENDPDRTTRADSRQIERCLAEFYGVKPPESKSYYDFAVEINSGGGVVISAASVKSKEIVNLRDFRDPAARVTMRAYLEIANSSAKDWKLCRSLGLSEDDFRAQRQADRFGEAILSRQAIERTIAVGKIQRHRKNAAIRTVDADASVFLSVLYSPMDRDSQRDYLISSYPIILPQAARWAFRGRALVGFDDQDAVLYEWYALSGSQFKYYPLLSSRKHGTELFQLLKPAQESLHQKAIRMFGHG